MATVRGSLRRSLAVCLAIGAVLGGLFGVALLSNAVTGNGTPSSILLGGFGFIMVVLSVLALVYAIRQWRQAKPIRH
jgi:hypothetical protein